MIKPEEINQASKDMSENNMNFRLFLKENSDEEELDAQFLALHNEIFSQYDCGTCLNCCKKLTPIFLESELKSLAKAANMEVEDLTDLCEQTDYEEYQPIDEENCPILSQDGCMAKACKPESCKDFPYTNQRGRKESLLGMLSFITVCPVAFEIFERLKVIYGFKNK